MGVPIGPFEPTRIDEARSGVIRTWTSAGRLAPFDPKSLLFVLWATTQHGADFSVQVEALTEETVVDPAFLERTAAGVQAVVRQGVAAMWADRRRSCSITFIARSCLRSS